MVAEPHPPRAAEHRAPEDLLASIELASWLARLAAIERDWLAAHSRPEPERRFARLTHVVETECLMIELEERFGAGLALRIVRALTERGMPADRLGLG